MTNVELVNKFLKGTTRGKAGNLKIDGDKLIQYKTTIAQFINGRVVINKTWYSRTTKIIQNILMRELPETEMVDNVPEEETDLVAYLKEVVEV